jgi:uncharacterized membrane protein YhaH (DUF805 family)
MGWQWLFFSFQGRINRAKYWLAVLIYVAGMVFIASVLAEGLNLGWSGGSGGLVVGLTIFILYFVLVVSGLAVGAKRLHDRGRSGWWLFVFYFLPSLLSVISDAIGGASGSQAIGGLFGLIPIGIWIWAFVELACLPGTAGPNKYGPNPLEQKL